VVRKEVQQAGWADRDGSNKLTVCSTQPFEFPLPSEVLPPSVSCVQTHSSIVPFSLPIASRLRSLASSSTMGLDPPKLEEEGANSSAVTPEGDQSTKRIRWRAAATDAGCVLGSCWDALPSPAAALARGRFEALPFILRISQQPGSLREVKNLSTLPLRYLFKLSMSVNLTSSIDMSWKVGSRLACKNLDRIT
jgi:hypothetical protein